MTAIQELYKIFGEHPIISTDSRQIENGSLFFALKGENFNGNKFAHSALEKGASYAIIDEEEYHTSDQTILVNDVLQTLKELANYHRIKLAIPILSITGTNGKTTTKELIAAVLSQKFKVSFTQGNLNNHIGVPLTLLKMNDETEFGVVEMGANHPGEIAELCLIAEPDFGIITNIGKAHLEGFGSFEGVIQTKTELYRFLEEKGGTVFYNHDNPLLRELAGKLKNRVSFGSTDADFIGENVQSPPFVHVKAKFTKGILYLNSNLIGNYNAENILAAACIGNYFNVDPLKIQQALKSYQPTNNRSQLIQKNGLKIIMDAYNANPTSMQASIKSFFSNKSENNYLILGDMLELGNYSKEEHTKILELLKDYSVTKTFVVGRNFSELSENYDCIPFLDVDQLCLYLQQNRISTGNILIKGSRGIRLEKALSCF
ncbi:MAG: UDP-N-acetylmuramoyl-tripeptide--D-alanyl-D-alanine ligase [Draconibacterium sp.]